MTEPIPQITGFGYAVPSCIRLNSDPVFDWLRTHHPEGQDLFLGYEERRVLAKDEDLFSVMVPAAQMALKDAGLAPADIDLLLGTGSVGPYINPNPLSGLHKALQLPASAWVIPLANEFSNYSAALLMADSLIRAGHAKNILVCVGGNWTQNVSYQTPQSVSAGDGAGAAVVSAGSQPGKWKVIAHNTVTNSQYYGSMFTSGDQHLLQSPVHPDISLWTDHYFQIGQEGIQGFKSFGAQTAASAVTGLLKSHNLTGADITLIAHQASTVLSDAWAKIIGPAAFITTLKQYGNMALANVPVTFAWAEKNAPISTGYLILFSMGPDMHANALLLQKGNDHT